MNTCSWNSATNPCIQFIPHKGLNQEHCTIVVHFNCSINSYYSSGDWVSGNNMLNDIFSLTQISSFLYSYTCFKLKKLAVKLRNYIHRQKNAPSDPPPLPPRFVPDPHDESELELQLHNVNVYDIPRRCGDNSDNTITNSCYGHTMRKTQTHG